MSPEEIIMSEDYIDLISHKDYIDNYTKTLPIDLMVDLPNNYVAMYMKAEPELNCQDYLLKVPYYHVPFLFALSSIPSLEASGIGQVIRNDNINIRGTGVLVGVIDTGINYLSESFRYADGTTKIESIWDQTLKGNKPEGFLFGAEYTREDIDKALSAENPYDLVPSKDHLGHGTFIAGAAAGNDANGVYSGAAPDAELLVVKLKPAKQCIRDLFLVNEEAVAYTSVDILYGIEYLIKKAQQLRKPLVILCCCETNQGSHDGTSYVEETLAGVGKSFGIASVVAAGNEGSGMRHYRASNYDKTDTVRVDINIGGKENGFIVFMYSNSIHLYEVEFIAPNGESTGKIPLRDAERQEFSFRLGSFITIEYVSALINSINQGIFVRIKEPLDGLWSIIVYGENLEDDAFDVWLPPETFINSDTFFLQPNHYTTVTTPGTNVGTITVGAYNNITGGIYVPSGRGYTRDLRVKPDFVAPGVDLIGPSNKGETGNQIRSGTSVSAGITAGACALLLQWGIVKGNMPTMNTLTVKTYLRRSATRREAISYPNAEWGYGELFLDRVFKDIEALNNHD